MVTPLPRKRILHMLLYASTYTHACMSFQITQNIVSNKNK